VGGGVFERASGRAQTTTTAAQLFSGRVACFVLDKVLFFQHFSYFPSRRERDSLTERERERAMESVGANTAFRWLRHFHSVKKERELNFFKAETLLDEGLCVFLCEAHVSWLLLWLPFACHLAISSDKFQNGFKVFGEDTSGSAEPALLSLLVGIMNDDHL